ncbi:MAG: hypothetical protein ACOC3J_01495, partial [Gemmatimonadota bacterium]
MTREGRAPGPEDTFAPPASTRTEEALPEADHALAPPFVPGRAPVEADEGLAPPFLPGRAPDAREAPEEPVELIETDDDSFPFDTFEAEPEDAAAEPEDAGLDAENQWGPE